MRNVLGFLGGGLLVVSSAAHSFFGWKGILAELAKTNAPPDLVTGLGFGWHFGGVAMLILGVIVLLQFSEVRRNPSASLRSSQLVALGYLLFGVGVLLVARDPIATFFLVPGALLAAGSWGRR